MAFYAACQQHMMEQYCCGSGSTNKLFCVCFLHSQKANEVILNVIIIIMVTFKCYFSGDLIALSYNKKKKKKQLCEHRIRKNKQIKSTVHVKIKKLNKQTMCQ